MLSPSWQCSRATRAEMGTCSPHVGYIPTTMTICDSSALQLPLAGFCSGVDWFCSVLFVFGGVCVCGTVHLARIHLCLGEELLCSPEPELEFLCRICTYRSWKVPGSAGAALHSVRAQVNPEPNHFHLPGDTGTAPAQHF